MPQPIKINPSPHLAVVLRQLSNLPKKTEDGRLSWESNELDRGTFELIYSLKFTPPVDDHIKDGAIWHTLNECAQANDFTVHFFIRKLQKFVMAHLSKRPKLLTAISQVNCTILASLPKKIPSVLGPVEFQSTLSTPLEPSKLNYMIHLYRSRMSALK